MPDENTPSAGVDPHLGPDQYARRELPVAKDVSERLRDHRGTSGSPVGAPLDPAEAWARLQQFNKDILRRYQQVVDAMVEVPEDINPTQHSDFATFVQSELASANMFYVVSGSLPPGLAGAEDEDPDRREFEDSADGIDPVLASNPAARAAIEAGADLTGARDDIDDIR